ncbi:MAG: amidohydrolase [Bacteroidetes bacterium]|nr:MAG: amidohydrolase [Bacteroidota bacterium]
MKIKLSLLLIFSVVMQEGMLAQKADIILTNGKIFTSDTTHLYVQALAIKGNKIIAAGADEAIKKFVSSKTQIIDLKGKTVVPGFNDAHTHVGPNFPAYRFQLTDNPLEPTPWTIIKDSLIKIVKRIPAETFIIISINPDLLGDTAVRRKTLDSIAPQNPVMLSVWTGHGKILNSAALKFFGFNEQMSFEGGRLDKDANHELTGLFEEYAQYRIGAELSKKLEPSKIINDLKAHYEQTAALGITTVQNMCTQHYAKQAVDIYSTQEFPCRVRLMALPFTDSNELLLHNWDNFFHPLNKMNYVSGVKLILDGTPLERLACMRTPYKDKPNEYGHLNFNEAQLKRYMQYCLAHKQQIIIHAVGDSSIVTIIRSMRSLYPDGFWKNKRLRIEHGDFAVEKPEDINTLKQLGIVIVQNPSHLALPPIMTARFQDTKRQYLQAMQTLLNNKIPLAIGSDGPFNPFLNIMLATMHPNNPREAITVEEAVIAYTYGSAFAEFKENEKGTLTTGKLADLAVLSQDIFSIPKEQLPSTKSILTMIDGKIVYKQQ